MHEPVPPPPVPLPAPRVALAEPDLELWMEGTKPVDPAESARTLEEAREALAQALSGRGLDEPDPEQVLVVHARAIARTRERRTAQLLSVVGIVVVVVAIVVVAIVLSRKKSPPARSAPGHGVRPAPLQPGPGPYAPAFVPRFYPPPVFFLDYGLAVSVPEEPPLPAPWLVPDDAWLESRGWFDRDAVELTAELTDPKTGAVTWRNTVQGSVDPRDPEALSALVDRALDGLPFGRREANPVESPALTE